MGVKKEITLWSQHILHHLTFHIVYKFQKKILISTETFQNENYLKILLRKHKNMKYTHCSTTCQGLNRPTACVEVRFRNLAYLSLLLSILLIMSSERFNCIF